MRKTLPLLPFALAISLSVAAFTGCGSSDDMPAPVVPDAAGPDSAADASQEATPSAEASPSDSTTADAPADATLADAPAEATRDATAETSADAPAEARPDADAGALADADASTAPDTGLDACSIPDAAIPDAPIGDTGATTGACFSCIDTTCATQVAACNGDCTCAAQAVSVFTCAAGGQSVASCLASTGGNTAFNALAFCVGFLCTTPCGL